jgi:hypothetical protein
MNDLHLSFRLGAEKLATSSMKYASIHREHGMMEADWTLLVQEEPWTPEEARKIRAILASCIEVCMTIAGLPAVPLPGQYAAACIAVVVAPANRFLAVQKVPDTFDAAQASGLEGAVEIKPMRSEQLFSLVMAYSGGFGGEPMPRLPAEVNQMRQKGNEK